MVLEVWIDDFGSPDYVLAAILEMPDDCLKAAGRLLWDQPAMFVGALGDRMWGRGGESGITFAFRTIVLWRPGDRCKTFTRCRKLSSNHIKTLTERARK